MFVVLDNVQFRERYYQNRTKIFLNKDVIGWLTIPVKKKFGECISEAKISDPAWRDKMLRSLYLNYRKSTHFTEIYEFVGEVTKISNDSILDLSVASIKETVRRLGFNDIIIKRSSEITNQRERTERIIEICEKTGVSNLIYGEGGSWLCHDYDRLVSNGVRIIQQKFSRHHPTYKQFGKRFYPNLSILDCLFHCGFEETSNLLRSTWSPVN